MTTAQIVQLLLAIGAGGIATSSIQGYLQRKKVGADYATAVAISATGWVKAQEERIERAEARAERAEERAEHAEQSAQFCHRRVNQLEQALHDHDIPIPPPLVDLG